MSEERSAELIQTVFIPALTADFEHDHEFAGAILKEAPAEEMVEVLFGFAASTLHYQGHAQGVDPREILRRMAMMAAWHDQS
jgi:hypothetical protein